MALSSSLLSICPRIGKRDGKLVAATGWRFSLLTLGCHYREVVIDPKKKELVVHRRLFWVFRKRRRILFRFVEAVTYSYQDYADDESWTTAYDSTDFFTVGLRLVDREDVHLFYFYGDGTFANHGPWPDWMYWPDYLFDLAGSQERESKGFVELLSKMMNVTVIPGRS